MKVQHVLKALTNSFDSTIQAETSVFGFFSEGGMVLRLGHSIKTWVLVSFYLKLLVLLTLSGSLMRVIFALAHFSYFQDLTLGQGLESLFFGLRFDLAVGAIIAVPFIFLAWLIFRLRIPIKTSLFLLLPLYLLVGFQTSDMMYFSDSHRHMSYEIKYFWTTWQSLFQAAFKDHFLSLACFFLFIFASIFFVLKKSKVHKKTYYNLGLEISLIFILVINFIFIRGGLQEIRLKPFQVYRMTENVKQSSLIMNGAYTMVLSFYREDKVEKVPVFSFSQEKTKDLLERGGYFERKPIVHELKVTENKKYNIFLIFLESWSNYFMYDKKQSYVPFFDSLKRKSLRPLEGLAGGRRSPEGFFSVVCSNQNPLGLMILESQLHHNDFLCIPKILRDKGYQTLFIKGTFRDTISMGTLVRRLGFEKDYGTEDFLMTKFKLGTWGVHDPDIYEFALDKIKNGQVKEPFLLGILTNTTHSFNFPEGVEPLLKSKDVASKKKNQLYFADGALKKFIESRDLEKLKNPSIFVLVADHTADVDGTFFDNFSIPFLIYTPSQPHMARLVKTSASHRDVAPTLLDLLGEKIPSSFTGRSLLRPSKRGVDYYQDGFLGWIVGDERVEVRLNDRFLSQCYSRIGTSWKQRTCQSSDQDLADQGVAFTRRSQDLLFSDKLKDFTNLQSNSSSQDL